MKKLFFLTLIASVSFSALKAANTTKSNTERHLIEVCSQKQSFFANCGGGKQIEIAVVTIFYDCSSGKISNTDIWQSGKTCDDTEVPQEVPF
ncbi:MAG: hypothetical protein MH132_06285 [Hydrotalea sp.]|nr:hypothetical protein [Hydrotalea sp.]